LSFIFTTDYLTKSRSPPQARVRAIDRMAHAIVALARARRADFFFLRRRRDRGQCVACGERFFGRSRTIECLCADRHVSLLVRAVDGGAGVTMRTGQTCSSTGSRKPDTSKDLVFVCRFGGGNLEKNVIPEPGQAVQVNSRESGAPSACIVCFLDCWFNTRGTG